MKRLRLLLLIVVLLVVALLVILLRRRPRDTFNVPGYGEVRKASRFERWWGRLWL